MTENIHEEVWRPSKNPWIISIPLMIAMFMFVLDETISNVALPYMAGTFSVSHNESTWILTFYLIASGLIIPCVDFLCRKFGRNNYFLFSVVLFTVASFMCGCSRSLGEIIVSRFLQGIGGGALLPLSQSMMLESFPKEDRGMAMSLFGFAVVMGPIIGPALGGWITETWSWPYIYLINIPFGFIAIIAGKMLLEESPLGRKVEGTEADSVGIFFLIGWIVALQIVLDKGNDADWFGSTWVCWLTAVSVISCIAFFISQIKNKHNALIDLSIMKDQNFFFGTLIQIVLMAVLMASSAILPSMLQSLMGYTSFLSGLSMVPRGAGSLTGIICSALLNGRISERAQVMLGLFFIGCGGLIFGQLNLEIALMNIAIPNYLFGVGLTFSMVPIINLSMITLKNSQLTNASGVQNMLKNIGGAIGTSLVTTFISRFSQKHQMMMVGYLRDTNQAFVERVSSYVQNFLPMTVDPASATNMAHGLLYQELQLQATLWAYIDTFRIFGAACFAIIPLLLLMKSIKSLAKEGLIVDE
ncbi:MAG: DHA2 family efflux MFS transporter permease subunit [Candidatus Gastranaerophilales bacterium]|nr:DHA2 family efflux MFS transporter permease subunit [Candidatus Gastranaerophilales bacterium]